MDGYSSKKRKSIVLLIALIILSLSGCISGAAFIFRGKPSLSLPVDKQDFPTHSTMGIWPFCVHGGDHPEGHGGIDFELREGAEVKAADSGIVIRIIPEDSGHNVFILHRGLLITGYIPLTDLKVGLFSIVVGGQVLGTAGKAGEMYFLHFEASDPRKNVRVCPYNYFNDSGKKIADEMFALTNYPEKSQEPFICNCEYVPPGK